MVYDCLRRVGIESHSAGLKGVDHDWRGWWSLLHPAQ